MASQNVEASLMENKTVRRKRGGVPYPVVHSTCTSSLCVKFYPKSICLTNGYWGLFSDVWDSMFINSCCRSLSMHQFEKPPGVVLDLGCGTGFWAIEAAKHWVVCITHSTHIPVAYMPTLDQYHCGI